MVVRDGSATVFNDQWGAMSVAEVFADGPERCLRWLEDHDRAAELLDDTWAEGGFLVDLDRRVALVFASAGSSYSGWDDLLHGLSEDERQRVAADDAALQADPEEWLRRIRSRWSGFELAFVDGVDQLTDYLARHQLPTESARPDEDGAESWDPVAQIIADLVSDSERRRQLAGDEQPPVVRASRFSYSVILVVAPLALLARLLTAPIRWLVRPQERAEQRADERRAELYEELREQSARLAVDPSDARARFDRGLLLLSLGRCGQADVDFDHCIELLEGGADHDVELGSAVHNRGIARARLGLSQLAGADRTRAAELGVNPPRVGSMRAGLTASWAMFRFIAGW